jgi:hypothetical protein
LTIANEVEPMTLGSTMRAIETLLPFEAQVDTLSLMAHENDGQWLKHSDYRFRGV